jgi:uncharacterized protein YjbI with pentapeptide repeats
MRLIQADLSGANLDGAALRESDLSRADLSRANLRNTDLSHAHLYYTNFNGAELNFADLSYANLQNANLSHTDLRSTNLQHTQLQGSRFNKAAISETIFADVDMRGIEGLEDICYLGRSELSVSTLHLSEGRIPNRFLHGCGLSEWEIEQAKLYNPELSAAQIVDILYRITELRSDPLLQFYSCFISYSHADQAFARRLHDSLQCRGVRCWLDMHQLLPGQDIMEEVDRGIRLWDKVLLCCSQHSLSSWWVDNEITTAFDKERLLTRDRGQKTLALVPLNLDGYLFSGNWQSGKKAQILSRLAADFTGWQRDKQKFETQMERLLRAMRADNSGRERPPMQKL